VSEALEPILISIQLENERIKQQLNDVTGYLEKLGKTAQSQKAPIDNLEKSTKGLGESLKKLFVWAEILKFMKESASVAIENQKSFALMSLTIKNATNATDAQVKATDKQLDAMSENAGVMLNKIRPAYDVLVRATGDTTKALKLQKLALDISAGTGKDLTTVSMALGKAMSGQGTALNKLVPGIKDVSDKMGFLEKNFKGAAKTAADKDPYARLQVMMEKLKITLGQALMPILTSLVKVLKPLLPVFDAVSAVLGKVIKAVMPVVVAIINALMPAFNAIMKVVIVLVNSIMPPLIKVLDKLLLPIIKMVGSYIADYLVPYWLLLIKVLSPVVNFIADVLVGAFQKLMSVLGPIWQIVKPLIDGLMSLAGIKVEPTIAPKVDDSGLGDLGNLNIDTGDLKIANGSGAKALSVGQKLLAIQTKFQADTLAAKKKFDADVQNLDKDHSSKILEIQKSFTDKMAGIIQSSKDELRSAFADATKFDVGGMFLDAGTNLTAFIGMLKNKLTGAKTLAEDSASLAGAGYSQTFIESILAQGPMMGDALSKQLLTATPDQAKSVQLLFEQVQQESAHGVDTLADSIYAKSGLATEQLKNAYVSAQSELSNALIKENDLYAASTVDLQNKYEAAMTKLQTTRDTAIAKLGISGTDLTTNGVTAVTGGSPTTKTSPTGFPTTNTHINVSVASQSNASPDLIANTIVQGIKFGVPIKSAPLTPQMLTNWLNQQPQIPASPTH
jgi:phage-related protein